MSSRGQMTRADRKMPDAQARAFLRAHALAHVGTNDADGWPYVVPLMYVYEEGEHLYLHTGTRGGHFRTNVGEGARICLSIGEQGPMHTGTPSPCNSSLTYESAIVFGTVRVYDGADLEQRKIWFFDHLLERLGDSPANYKSGYNMLKQIELYEVSIEILTGKINPGLHH